MAIEYILELDDECSEAHLAEVIFDCDADHVKEHTNLSLSTPTFLGAPEKVEDRGGEEEDTGLPVLKGI